MIKTCSCCHESKDISEFHRDRKSRDGYKTQCKTCDNHKRSERRKQVKSDEYIKCPSCNKIHHINDCYKMGNSYRCKTCQKKSVKKWIKNNPDKHQSYTQNWNDKNPEYSRKYYLKNPEKCNERSRQFHKKQRDQLCDPYCYHLINMRTGKSLINKDNKQDYLPLIQKQRKKLKIERQIKKEIIEINN